MEGIFKWEGGDELFFVGQGYNTHRDPNKPKREVKRNYTLIPADEHNNIISEYRSGKTSNQIAAMFGCTQRTVLNILKSKKVTIKTNRDYYAR